MKDIIKKWWFWLIVVIIIATIIIFTLRYGENKKTEEAFSNIAQGATDFIEGTENATSHIDDFSYNYVTGEVEYKPSKITLEMYNRIEEGMQEEKVILNLGKYDNQLEADNTYLLQWGDMNMGNGYWINITFDKETKTVISKSQIGLK